MADAQGEEHPVQPASLDFSSAARRFSADLSPIRVERRHRVGVEMVKIVYMGDQAGVHELLEHGRAEPLDIHGVSRGEVDQVAQTLGRDSRDSDSAAASSSSLDTGAPQDGQADGISKGGLPAVGGPPAPPRG